MMEASEGTEMEGVALIEAGDSWCEGDAQGVATAMTTVVKAPPAARWAGHPGALSE